MNIRTVSCCILVGMIVLCPLWSAWAGGEGESGKVEHKASTEGKSGVWLWLVELYNEHLFYYAVLVVVSMAVGGVAIGLVTNKLFKMIGMG